ncbi:MAG: LytTR family transcriptional regulator [Roseivirga sp.]|nr:LytTR family transcriptional regulator [Roseivirga sp.]
MKIRAKIILFCGLIWTSLVGFSLLLQFLVDKMEVSSLVLREQLNTWLFGLVLISIIVGLQFLKKFPELFDTKWYLFHIIISAFSYLTYNSLFVQITTLPGNSSFVQKTSSFGNTLLDGILGNGFGSYAMVLLIFALISRNYLTQKSENQEDLVPELSDRIKVKLANRTYFLRKDDILFIRSANNYTDLYTLEGKHVIRESIGKLENELDPTVFMRIHRSIIIKIDEVKEFISSGNGDYKVKLHNEETFNIGNKYKNQVVEKFGL